MEIKGLVGGKEILLRKDLPRFSPIGWKKKGSPLKMGGNRKKKLKG